MAKLNQIIAVEKGIKSESLRDLTDAHQLLQKPALLSGISRTYRPKDEEGEQLPPESTKVQVKANEVIRTTVGVLIKLFDVTATKDWANGLAKADVTVDGNVLLDEHDAGGGMPILMQQPEERHLRQPVLFASDEVLAFRTQHACPPVGTA